MDFLAQMPSRSDLSSLIPWYNGMTGCVNGGGLVDIKFNFNKVFLPSFTALNAFGLVLAVGLIDIYQWLHVQLTADNKKTTMMLKSWGLTQVNVFIINNSDTTEGALSKLGGVVNMLSRRDSVQRGLEKFRDGANIKSVKFSKRCRVLSNLMHQCRWGQPAWLKRSLNRGHQDVYEPRVCAHHK